MRGYFPWWGWFFGMDKNTPAGISPAVEENLIVTINTRPTKNKKAPTKRAAPAKAAKTIKPTAKPTAKPPKKPSK